MTQLPMESWNVKGRPDLPEYELALIDARPGSSSPATEDHHIWRRSFTAGPCWWVELDDGTLIPNVVKLSQKSHELIERGGHRIVAIRNVVGAGQRFFWLTPDALAKLADRDLNPYEHAAAYGQPLHPQPGPQVAADGHTSVGTDAVRGDMQLDVEGGEVPHDGVCETHDDEVPCSRCKGSGKVPKPEPKPEGEQAPERKKVTWAVRVPKDEREDGYETLENLVEGSVELLKDARLLQNTNKGANYYALVYVLAFFQQNFRPEQEVST